MAPRQASWPLGTSGMTYGSAGGGGGDWPLGGGRPTATTVADEPLPLAHEAADPRAAAASGCSTQTGVRDVARCETVRECPPPQMR